MGSLSNFVKAAQNIKSRRGSFLVAAAGSTISTGTKYSLGVVRDTMVRFEPVKTSRDNVGREHQLGADINVTATLMQTSYSVEFANLAALLDPANNGIFVFITDEPKAPTVDHTGDAGIMFDNATLTLEGELQFNGEESFFTVGFMGRVTNADLENIGSAVIDLDPA